MLAKQLVDPEFGVITIKRIPRSRSVRLHVRGDGRLQATMPRLAPLYILRQLVDTSRRDLRQALNEQPANRAPIYRDRDQIGASHHIVVETGQAKARVKGQTIIWTVPASDDPTIDEHQATVRAAVQKALRREAEAYLPRRLSYLASQHGFSYKKLRYGNPKGRWGSCSSGGTISLNIALMRLPIELIDYVLIHELSHTRHMNHSTAFWQQVAAHYPDYKAARKAIKNHNPYI